MINNFSDLYTSSEYALKNPSYHEEDSKFKWKNFEKCLKNASNKNLLEYKSIHSIVEIGCGTGGILKSLQESDFYNSKMNIEGWDINPSAIEICKSRFPDIPFFNGDLLENDKKYDLLICADVFEHVEDQFKFLKKLIKKSNFFIFNIPIELHLLSMLRGKRILKRSFDRYGHINFYSTSSAKLILELSGFQIIISRFARDRTSNFLSNLNFKKLISSFPQLILENIDPYFSSVIMGDHLVVLAKNNLD